MTGQWEDGVKVFATPPDCDTIGDVLHHLGVNYKEIDWNTLLKPNALNNCDALFLNCSHHARHYADSTLLAIQNFVRTGGSLYVSGEACVVIEHAFAGVVEFAQENRRRSLFCQVLDADLRAMVGATLTVQLNQRAWWRVVNAERTVHSYLTVQDNDGQSSPLAIAFQRGHGQVIFTSFHNQAMASGGEADLLRFLVLQTVGNVRKTVAQTELPLALYDDDRELMDVATVISVRLDPEPPALPPEPPPPPKAASPPAPEPESPSMFPVDLPATASVVPPPAHKMKLKIRLVEDELWPCYILLDCSGDALPVANQIGQGVALFLRYLKSKTFKDITPGVAFGACRKNGPQMPPLQRLSGITALDFPCSDQLVLGPYLHNLAGQIMNAPAGKPGKPLIVIVLASEPADSIEPAAQKLHELMDQGKVNVMAIGLRPAISDDTLKRLAAIPLRVMNPDDQSVAAGFQWLAEVAEMIVNALAQSGAGQGIHLPPLPEGIALLGFSRI